MSIASVSTSRPPGRAPEIARPASRDTATQANRESGSEKRLEPTSARPPQEVQKSELQDAVKRLNDFVAPSQSEISFSIDDESGVRVVKILDSQSKEVIRQIPSEEAIELARALDKLQGLLIKDKA